MCAVPQWDDAKVAVLDAKLKGAYTNTIKRAEEAGVRTLGFCLISAGEWARTVPCTMHGPLLFLVFIVANHPNACCISQSARLPLLWHPFAIESANGRGSCCNPHAWPPDLTADTGVGLTPSFGDVWHCGAVRCGAAAQASSPESAGWRVSSPSACKPSKNPRASLHGSDPVAAAVAPAPHRAASTRP